MWFTLSGGVGGKCIRHRPVDESELPAALGATHSQQTAEDEEAAEMHGAKLGHTHWLVFGILVSLSNSVVLWFQIQCSLLERIIVAHLGQQDG